jgi:hypothetical protein
MRAATARCLSHLSRAHSLSFSVSRCVCLFLSLLPSVDRRCRSSRPVIATLVVLAVTVSDRALSLTPLSLSAGLLSQPFRPNQYAYSVSVDGHTAWQNVSGTLEEADLRISFCRLPDRMERVHENGPNVNPDTGVDTDAFTSRPIALRPGTNIVHIWVEDAAGQSQAVYSLRVQRGERCAPRPANSCFVPTMLIRLLLFCSCALCQVRCRFRTRGMACCMFRPLNADHRRRATIAESNSRRMKRVSMSWAIGLS